MMVVIADHALANDAQWQKWLAQCESHASGNPRRHFLIALCLDDETFDNFEVIEDSDYSEKRGYDEVDDRQGVAAARSKNTSVFGEHAERAAWFALYVLQCCRKLLTRAICDDLTDARHQLKIFISHAKKDSLSLANSVRSALKERPFFASWYDAEDLNQVTNWREAIREGVTTSVVVVLRTGEYDKRPWCRQEFLWAEQCCVPIVCVEARVDLEYDADPLATSRVPNVRIPDGNLFRILFAALKESLRVLRLERVRLHLQDRHDGFKRAIGVNLIPYAPELNHLVHASRAIREQHQKVSLNDSSHYQVVLYADPPLSTERYEANRDYLERRCGRTYLLTPSLLPFWAGEEPEDESEIRSRSLMPDSARSEIAPSRREKLRVNLSISEHEADLEELGLGLRDVNDFTVHLAEAILANEGIVSLGHDWRADGVMRRIYCLAEERQEIVLPDQERSGMIENYAFWGNKPGLEDRERNLLKGVLDIVECKKPDDLKLQDFDSLPACPPQLKGYAFARSLTTMRKQMTDACFARVCLGGRDMDPERPEAGPSGRFPGVAEEAYLSCVFDRPLYLSALIGGVTGKIVKAFMDQPAELQFRLPEQVAVCYEDEEQRPGDPDYDGPIDSPRLLAFFGEYGIGRLSENNGLTPEENIALFHAVTIDEVREWVLTGLSGLVRKGYG